MERYYEILEGLPEEIRDKIFKALFLLKEEIAQTVTKEDFRELRSIVDKLIESHEKALERLDRIEKVVGELSEAQKRTEERLNKLTERVDQLAEAQRRTEERLNELAEAQRKTEERLSELAKAQRKTEERLNQLAGRVDQLAEAQRRTEERLNELTEAQRKTEERLNQLAGRVDQLAEAQRRTEERLNQLAKAQEKTEKELEKLIIEHRMTREQLGGLSHTVGYVLEDRAYKALPKLLKEDMEIEVIGKLKRDYIKIGRAYYEVNIIGEGRKDSEVFLILGDVKTQLKKKDVDRFLRFCEMVEKVEDRKQLRIAVTYQASPQVREYVKEKGVKLYFSYELD